MVVTDPQHVNVFLRERQDVGGGASERESSRGNVVKIVINNLGDGAIVGLPISIIVFDNLFDDLATFFDTPFAFFC